MFKLEDLKGKILSLDIETSGLNDVNDWIWSMGMADSRGNKVERFIKPPSWASSQHLKNDSFFSRQQEASGAFSGFFEAEKGGSLVDIRQALKELVEASDYKTAILIQNANFENRFIGQALAGIGSNLGLKDAMRYQTVGGVGEKYLYLPPEVTNLKNAAFDQMLEGASKESISDTYRQIVSTYRNLLNEPKGGAIVMDLMDFSTAMYAEAARSGYGSIDQIRRGTRVDYLSRVLLGEAEAHTALSDASQQLRLFGEINRIYDELKSGQVSDNTKKQVQRLVAGKEKETTREFIAGLKNTLQEIQTSEGTKIIYRNQPIKNLEPLSVVDMGDEGKLNYVNLKQHHGRIENDPRAALMNVLTRYSKEKMYDLDQSSRVALIEEVSSMDSLGKQIERLELLEDKYRKIVNESISMSDPDFNASRVKDAISAATEKVKSGFSSKKTIGAAAAIITGIGALSVASNMGKKDEEEYIETEKYRDLKKSNKRTFKMYEPHYHGTGFYMWENRTRHHEY